MRTGAIGAVISNSLYTVLEEVNSTGRDEYAMKAGGILRKNGEKAIVVVISPLRALMLDQAHVFSLKGVESVYVEAGNTYEAVTRGRVSLIFMSPESLMGCCKWREMFRSPIYQRLG